MLALRAVEHLDVIEHVLPGFFAGPIGSPSDPFPLEEVEEAFGHRVVVAASSAGHGVLKIVGAQEGGPIHAGELAALIGVDQHLRLGFASPDRHERGLQDDVRGLAALHRPSDDTPRIEVDDHREIGKALLRPDVGDVRDPDTIRCFDVELPVEGKIRGGGFSRSAQRLWFGCFERTRDGTNWSPCPVA